MNCFPNKCDIIFDALYISSLVVGARCFAVKALSSAHQGYEKQPFCSGNRDEKNPLVNLLFPKQLLNWVFFFYKRKWLPKPMAAACSMLFLLILIHPCQNPLFFIPPHFLSFWKPLAHSFKPHLPRNLVFQLKKQSRFSCFAVVSIGNTWGCCILYFSLCVFWKKESSLLPS